MLDDGFMTWLLFIFAVIVCGTVAYFCYVAMGWLGVFLFFFFRICDLIFGIIPKD